MELNLLTELHTLNLARNKLSSLPSNLRGLGNLVALDLSGNDIKDLAGNVSAIQHLTRLKTLYLRNNPLNKLEGLKNAALQILKAESCG